MSKIRPVGDRLIVQPNTEDVQQVGSLLAVEGTLDRGVVVAVSEALSELYKEGDVILYPKSSPISVVFNGQPCVWVEASQVWGIVN